MSPAIAQTELPVVRLAGRYEVVRELGAGESGRVLLVRDAGAHAALRALKLVRPEAEERVRCEFALLSRIAHPNLACVHALARVEDSALSGRVGRSVLALVSDYAPGLAADQAARALALARPRLLAFALRVLDQTARALSAVHAHGFVHGDVKPQNILVTPDGAQLCLVDLGFARAPGFCAEPSGTPRYMAPELWRGELSPAVDVFALGVVVAELFTKPAPDLEMAATAADYMRRALQPRAALPAWVPAPLAELLARMSAADRALRPASASALLDALRGLAPLLEASLAAELTGAVAEARTAQERASAVTALPLCGQDQALAQLLAAMRSGTLAVVHGPPGAGRSRLVRDAVFALQSERAAAGEPVPSYLSVSRLPQLLESGAVLLHARETAALELGELHALQLAASVAQQPLLLVLEREQPLTAAERDRLGQAPVEVVDVAVGPLDAQAVTRLLKYALPQQSVKPALVQEALAASAGLGARLCQLLAAVLLAEREPTQTGCLREFSQRSGVLPASLPEMARPLLELLAVVGGSLPLTAASGRLSEQALSEQAHTLCALGLCSRSASDGRLALRSDVQRAVWLQLAAARRAELARVLSGAQLEGRARGFLAFAAGDADAGFALFSAQAVAALRSGDPAQALEAVRDARALQAPVPQALCVLEAEALRALGQYQDALRALESAQGRQAEVLGAEILRLCGEGERARAACEALLAHEPADAHAHALLARLAFDRGELERSRELASRAAGLGAQGPAALRAAEVLALCALERAELPLARSVLETALSTARKQAERIAEARLLAVFGALERAQGDLQAAARAFARAYELAVAQGEYHAAASFLINLGTAQLDAGELGPALRSLDEGARRLARLGRQRDLARALANLVLAAQLTGNFERALSLGKLARQTAVLAADGCAQSFVTLSCAEIWLERAQLEAARQALAELPALTDLPPLDRAIVHCRAAVLYAALNEREAARQQLSAADTIFPDAAAADVEHALACAAVARLSGDRLGAAQAAEHALRAAKQRGEFAVQVLSLQLAARAAEEQGEAALARSRYAELRSLLDAAALTLTAADRSLLRGVAAYRAALSGLPSAPSPAGDGDRRFRQLSRIVQRLSAETHLPRLYDAILDAAVELSGAETGVLIRKDADGATRVRAARSVGGRTLDAAQLSQSIVARVLATGQPLSTVDAAQDDRLQAASSVHALSLRSVLALPLSVQGVVSGVIYLDDRLRPFAFGEAELALLSDFSELASVALTGLERLRRERRAVRRLSLAQARLSRQVEAQAIELASWKSAEERSGEYPGIVAESAPMRELLTLALRVARADVPVLIRGESGTGKELIAKAIHEASTRRKAPFVSENCGAIPESLLESALFGHVKGAFTGADRRRIGLFEAADSGTLLLDEIGEMTPSMQSRLLRVLQEGEVRPLGSERAVRVDVRVLAATHRDLEAMVAAGKFREDLFYRLAVVNLSIPPLRERSDDVLPLVRYFIHKHAPGRNPRLDRRALDRLLSQTWPGNVRQLENEVRRALVLGGDVLREEHFSFGQPREAGAGDAAPLDMRAQIDQLERRLIRRALELAKGNQTRAASLLGVSRFGLQKMVKRLGIEV